MYNQTNRSRFVNIGNKTLGISRYDQPQGIVMNTKRSQREHLKTQLSSEMGPDSLQLFQQQINSVLKGIKNNKTFKKPSKSRKQVDEISIPSKKSLAIKNQINEVKNLLQSDSQLKSMENRLERLLIQLEAQKNKPKKQQSLVPQMNPMPFYQPQQSMYYPPYMPQQYYYPPPPYYMDGHPHPRRKTKQVLESQGQQQQEEEKLPKNKQKPKKNDGKASSKSNTKQKIRTKLRMYLFVVAYTFFIRSQAKKLSTVRKNALKKFWTQKFESQVSNMKNWLLDSQKFSLSIILQKKSLNLVYFDDKSEKVKQQKKKLIMQIISIGINRMLQDSTPQKISLFSQILLNLCRRGSFAVSRFWTVADMEQICISQYYGFFRIDFDQQKFLIGLLVFIKVFIFNLFLQPSKFDVQNFPKKQQPLTTNMKLISSIYYHLVKDVINSYRDQNRDQGLYKIGNWLSVKKQFIVQCSEPLIYGNAFPDDQQYISGLFKAQQLSQLIQQQIWKNCTSKLKSIIEKLHVEMVNKGKMVKKNLKYKLYN